MIQNNISNTGIFMNINRYDKKTVGYPVRIEDYPYDKNWKVIISEPSFNQNWIHFLLTQRSFKKDEMNIFEELKFKKLKLVETRLKCVKHTLKTGLKMQVKII